MEHPAFQVGINLVASSYDIVHNPKYRDIAVVDSPLINEPISLWTHILQNEQEAIDSVKLFKGIGDYLVPCCYRCLTADTLTPVWASTYDIDKKYGTDYHQRFIEFVKEAQRNDWIIGAASIDPKGDRSLSPSQQPDPDLYVHVVERRKDGIIIRGAKCHSTGAVYTNILCIRPTSPREAALAESERDFAVGCFVPVDAEGLSFIVRPPELPPERKELNSFFNRNYGHVECLCIFDDVFVPWERVFMCGEYEFALPNARMRAASHAMHKCICRSTTMDLEVGATALIADCNGTEKAPHIQDYLAEMVVNAELTYSCAFASAIQGWKHESGAYIFKGAPASSGKVFAARKLGENRMFMQDAAGGLVGTMASEKDYKNPETRKLLEKYYKGRQEIPTEHRMRAFKLIEDLTGSPWAGWYHAMSISGGSGLQPHKSVALSDYDVEKSKRKAMVAAGIIEE